MEMFVIYKNPSDFPGRYVVRRWVVTAGGGMLAETVPMAVENNLFDARKRIPLGLSMLSRNPEDDPVIVEVWL